MQHHTVPKLKEVGMNVFKTIIYKNIKSVTTQEVLSVIRNDRDGLDADKNLIKSIVAVYETMGMDSLDTYITDLETPLLEQTRLYYSHKGLSWLEALDTPSYLQKAEEAFQQESDRKGISNWDHRRKTGKSVRRRVVRKARNCFNN